MYCATFYSYKGGVGRTLALVNVAAKLAIRGKRVLIVDFDLEAPGITTLDIFADARDKIGVVDFIHTYLEVGTAPVADAFIHTCSFSSKDSATIFEIDVMPAGDQSTSYGTNFAKIDWRALYDDQDGFLLMEDLREQWQGLGYDYVLIDSRTGLTDVSGICTRQLPDGVVMVFFPNEQNLVGLQEMVRVVRDSSARPETPQLLFVASRLPRLDDENGVLEKWLDRFKKALRYSDKQLCSLDQYDSLALLDQDVFVLTRPKTGLSKQYNHLTGLIAQLNDQDAQGSLDYIRSIAHLYSNPISDTSFFMDNSNPFSFVLHQKRLEAIEEVHVKDGVIQRHLAEHYYNLRDFAHLELVLKHGLAAGSETLVDEGPAVDTIPRLNQLRMKMGSETGEGGLASSSAVELLRCHGASERMIVEALMLLMTASPKNLPEPSEILYLQNGDIPTFVSLINKLGISSREADYNSKIAELAVSKFGTQFDDEFKSAIELALIAGGKFAIALSILGDSEKIADFEQLDVPDAFNRAMALWGRDDRPNIELFANLLPRADDAQSENGHLPNYQQCLGLINSVLGLDDKASIHLNRAIKLISEKMGPREVSCWSFVEETDDDFKQHCTEILKMSKDPKIVPLFIRKRM